LSCARCCSRILHCSCLGSRSCRSESIQSLATKTGRGSQCKSERLKLERVLLARTQPLVASEIAAPQEPVRAGTCGLGCREESEELPHHSDHRLNSADRPEPSASETAPGPPEAVKESLLNESFGDILSTTAFPFSSSSPVGLGHAPLRLSLPGPVSNLTRRPHQA
jgi:hypothetical protein